MRRLAAVQRLDEEVRPLVLHTMAWGWFVCMSIAGAVWGGETKANLQIHPDMPIIAIITIISIASIITIITMITIIRTMRIVTIILPLAFHHALPSIVAQTKPFWAAPRRFSNGIPNSFCISAVEGTSYSI